MPGLVPERLLSTRKCAFERSWLTWLRDLIPSLVLYLIFILVRYLVYGLILGMGLVPNLGPGLFLYLILGLVFGLIPRLGIGLIFPPRRKIDFRDLLPFNNFVSENHCPSAHISHASSTIYAFSLSPLGGVMSRASNHAQARKRINLCAWRVWSILNKNIEGKNFYMNYYDTEVAWLEFMGGLVYRPIWGLKNTFLTKSTLHWRMFFFSHCGHIVCHRLFNPISPYIYPSICRIIDTRNPLSRRLFSKNNSRWSSDRTKCTQTFPPLPRFFVDK